MNSEDLALLLGVLGGGFAGHFGSKRRREREREDKKLDREEEREWLKEIRAEEKFEAESDALKAAGRISDDSERRGELKDPNTFYNMMFNPSESDPLHEMMGGGTLADIFLGPTKYSDPDYRSIDNPNYVHNPEENMFNTSGVLGNLSMLIPGFGLAGAGARLGSKMISPMMKSLSRLRGGTPGAAATSPTKLPGSWPFSTGMNQGGRVEYNQGGIVDLYKRMNRG